MPVAQDSCPLHLIDAAGPADPLRRAVMSGHDPVLRRRLDLSLLRWRAARDVALSSRRVVAWGTRALNVAMRAEVYAGLFRPEAHARDIPAPPGQWHAAVSTRYELRRMTERGWPQQRLHLVPPPCDVPLEGRAAIRREMGLEEHYLWLLSAESGLEDGLRDAVWATAAVHLATRPRQTTQLLVWGEQAGHRRAHRFIDQLGVDGVFALARHLSYEQVVAIADAFVFLPRGSGATCTWSAAMAARAGLPGVASDTPVMRDLLGKQGNVRFITEPGYRPIMREMLHMVEAGCGRVEGDARFSVSSAKAAWQGAMARSLPERD